MQIKSPCLSDKDGDSITFTQYLYNMNDLVTLLITIKPMTKVNKLIKNNTSNKVNLVDIAVGWTTNYAWL